MFTNTIKMIAGVLALSFLVIATQNCSPAKFENLGVDSDGPLNSIENNDGLEDLPPVDDNERGNGDEGRDGDGRGDGNLSDPVACVEPIKHPKFKECHSNHSNHQFPTVPCPSDEDSKCVVICHVPPGNPAARHTIIVSANAVQAHMNHGTKTALKGGSHGSGAHGSSGLGKHAEKDSFGPCRPEDLKTPGQEICEYD